MGCGASQPVYTQAKFDPVSFRTGDSNPYYDMKEWKTLLGEGSYGEVYECVETGVTGGQGRVVALKLMDKNSEMVSGGLELLAIEVKVHKSLEHPNIIRMFNSHETLSHVAISMEICTGGELFDRICEKCEARTDFSMAEVGVMMFNMLDGINYMHKKGIAHRDLKPENLLLASKDSNVLKIADFGLALQMSAKEKSNEYCGSPGYMAPEVVENQGAFKDYDVKCDMWSLGVIFYVLLIGSPPFEGKIQLGPNPSDWQRQKYQEQVDRKVMSGNWDKCRTKDWEGYDEDAKDLVRKLIEVDQGKRLSSADALEHPFIKKENLDKEPFSSDYYQRLLTTQRAMKIRRKVLNVVSVLASFRVFHNDDDAAVAIQSAERCRQARNKVARVKDGKGDQEAVVEDS